MKRTNPKNFFRKFCNFKFITYICNIVKKIYQKSPNTIERENLLLENKKRCTKCRVIKVVTEFYKNKKIKCGYDSWCKECNDDKKSLYYQKSPKTIEREKLLKDNKKRCTKCDNIKTLNHFSTDKNVKCGYSSWCKECHKDNKRKLNDKEHQIRKEKNPEYYSLREERKKLLQQGKYKCYSCKEIKEVSKFIKNGTQYGDCKDCYNKKKRQKTILKNLSKDPDYYIKQEKKLEEKNKKLEEKNKKLEKEKLLLAEGKKECHKCNKVLPIVSFETIKKHHCISCHKEQKKIEKRKERAKNKIRYENDPEYRKRINKKRKERYLRKKYSDDEWRIRSNKMKNERYKERMKDPEYRKRVNKRSEKRRKERRNTDPVYAMKKRVSTRIRNFMSRRGYTKKTRTHEILGIDWYGFKEHIESQFVDGMSWENRNLWHIDHIIPLDSAVCEADIIRLNHYTNLQPLWAHDNLSKGSKIL